MATFSHSFHIQCDKYCTFLVYVLVLSLCPSSVLSPVISSPGTDLISGQQVNLTCSLSYPVPSDLQVKWLPPEQSQMFPLRSDHYPANLSWEVGTGDGGKWRCELQQNGTWLTSAVIMLKIGERRKWEGSRKYDMGMTLWSQSFLRQKLGFTWCVLCTVHCLMTVSVVHRAQAECVDEVDHMQCHSHHNPPHHLRFHLLPTQTTEDETSQA